jgi:hypothetical protein
MRLGVDGWWCVVPWERCAVRSACGTSRARDGKEPRSLLIFALAFYAIPFVCTANCTCIRDSRTAATIFFKKKKNFNFLIFFYEVSRTELLAPAGHVRASTHICRLDNLDMPVPHARPLHR